MPLESIAEIWSNASDKMVGGRGGEQATRWQQRVSDQMAAGARDEMAAESK